MLIPKKREAKLIPPSLSIVRGLVVIWFPGHIWRDGVGFQENLASAVQVPQRFSFMPFIWSTCHLLDLV